MNKNIEMPLDSFSVELLTHLYNNSIYRDDLQGIVATYLKYTLIQEILTANKNERGE